MIPVPLGTAIGALFRPLYDALGLGDGGMGIDHEGAPVGKTVSVAIGVDGDFAKKAFVEFGVGLYLYFAEEDEVKSIHVMSSTKGIWMTNMAGDGHLFRRRQRLLGLMA